MSNNRVIAAGWVGAAALALLLSVAASPASACSCQKEYMVKKYGSVSGLQATPAPESGPAAGSVPATPPAPAAAPSGG